MTGCVNAICANRTAELHPRSFVKFYNLMIRRLDTSENPSVINPCGCRLFRFVVVWAHDCISYSRG